MKSTALKSGADARTRTRNLLVRSQMLYPIEPHPHDVSCSKSRRESYKIRLIESRKKV